MNSEEINKPTKKRKERSFSDDDENIKMVQKRFKKITDNVISYKPQNLSTIYISLPFPFDQPVIFANNEDVTFTMKKSNHPIRPVIKENFEEEYTKFVSVADAIMGKKVKKVKKVEKRQLSLRETKVLNLLKYFQLGLKDFKELSDLVKLTKDQVRRYYIRFQQGDDILTNKKGKAKILSTEPIDYLRKFFLEKNNVGKTVIDLHQGLIQNFNFEKNPSFWTLYDYLEESKLSYKNIIYKHINADSESVKKMRVNVSLYILGALLESFHFIYIDETAFNLETWPFKAWAPTKKNASLSRPGKSINYSAITAMDSDGILGVKVVKGGVKSEEFFHFMQQLIESKEELIKSEKVVFFMDNASIHKTSDSMVQLSKFYNILYNAPYTPQLNPIEFAFSKIKSEFRQKRPKTEQELVKCIIESCSSITKSDACEYILHSIKLLKNAFNQEDFF